MGRRRVSEEHKRERKRAENRRREMTRIHLGTCHVKWAELKSLRNINNVELADHLLKVHEHYCKSCRNDAFMRLNASRLIPMEKRHDNMEVGKSEWSSILTNHFDGELRTGTISRVEDLQSGYDSRQDEVSPRESQSSRNVKVVNQNGQVYVTLGRDMQKSATGNSQQQQQQQQQQHQQQQTRVLVGSQPSVNSYQQSVLVHSPFVNKPQITNSDLKINQQSAFMNQIPSGYSIGDILPNHTYTENGCQTLSNSFQHSSGVHNPVSVQTAQRTSLTRENPQGHPDKGGVIQGNQNHVGRESGSGHHQEFVEKQLEVKEEPVDDFVVILNPHDDDEEEDEEEDEYDGETTDTCEESELMSEPHDKEFDLVEVKEEPKDDYTDHAGHSQDTQVQFIESIRGGRSLYFEKNKFRLNRQKGDRGYWKCTEPGCSARIVTSGDRLHTAEHNHDHPDPNFIFEVDAFKAKLVHRVKTQVTPIHQIYDEEIENLRKQHNVILDGLLQVIPSFTSLKTILYRQRHKTIPALPDAHEDISQEEGSVECDRGLQTTSTITNGTKHQPENSRMCLPDGNSFRSSNANTSPSLQEAIIEVVTCYRYGDLVNRHLTSSSNKVEDKQLMTCDNLLKQIPQIGTHVTQTEQDQVILRKTKHAMEEQEQTQKKMKHNV